jgi:hypothetical protein
LGSGAYRGRREMQVGNRVFDTKFGVARVLSNGAVDSSLGTGGSVVTEFPSNPADATAVTVQGGGKIVVGGTGGGGVLARWRAISPSDADTGPRCRSGAIGLANRRRLAESGRSAVGRLAPEASLPKAGPQSVRHERPLGSGRAHT